jgi:hypothetical protein
MDIYAVDSFMAIFGFKRVMDKTICLGIGCKVKRSCARYGVKAYPKWQSYMAACVDKVAFVGKRRK